MTKDSYIRAARPRDFERICDAGAASMLEDPVMSYFGCTTPASLKSYIRFTLHSTWQMGGLIDMMCVPSTDPEDDEGEKVGAIAIWLPPRKRITSWNVYTLLRSGILSLTQTLGAQNIMRMGWEYPSTAEESWKEGYFCFLDGPTWSHNDSWYLKLAFTSKPYQKKGMMSKMIGERLSKLPGCCFTLEVSSPKVQSYFRQFEFEIMNRSRLGAGYVDERGNESAGGSGVEICYMIKRSVEDPEFWEK
ncbi:hypothetical protein BJ912DRAFT_996530 [Pholiota molesta]|nr:hypothetical protein BJ912DRAFT_996530 [Pholiota molesta]